MSAIGELATAQSIHALPTTPVAEAARFMAELGIGDEVISDSVSTIRVVARGLNPTLTPTGDVCTTDVTIDVADGFAAAKALMPEETVRGLPAVDADHELVGIVSVEDLGVSEEIAAEDLRDIIQAIAATYGRQRMEH